MVRRTKAARRRTWHTRSRAGRFERVRWSRRLASLLGKVPDYKLARKAGVSVGAVRAERIRRAIPPVRTWMRVRWTRRRLALLGKVTDRELAAQIRTSPTTVSIKRRSLGIPPFQFDQRPRRSLLWTPARIALLGTRTDAKIAKDLGIDASVVRTRRRTLGIPAFVPPRRRIVWTKRRRDLLGRLPDDVVARRLGISASSVAARRKLEEGTLPAKLRKKPRSPAALRRVLSLYGDYHLRVRFGSTKKKPRACVIV
jgi:hypothetical protein